MAESQEWRESQSRELRASDAVSSGGSFDILGHHSLASIGLLELARLMMSGEEDVWILFCLSCWCSGLWLVVENGTRLSTPLQCY